MGTGKRMRRIAKIDDQLTHLPHVQHFAGLDSRTARRHMQHILPQFACLRGAVFPQILRNLFDKFFRIFVPDIAGQAGHTHRSLPCSGHIYP